MTLITADVTEQHQTLVARRENSHAFLGPVAHVAVFTSSARVARKAFFLFSLVVLAGAAPALGQSGAGFDPNANGAIHVVVVQPNGKILIGGDFTTLSPNGAAVATTRNRIARLNPDGTLDGSFMPDVNGRVLSIAVQQDGKILLGGLFTSVNGQTRNHIARLNGSVLDSAFNPGSADVVRSIALQADGKILVGGSFNGSNSIGGQARNYIARLDATTGLADSFDPNANNVVESIAVQANGRVLVGGQFNGSNSIGGQTRNFFARLDPTTGLADSFNPNANNVVSAIAVQADGKVLAGGNFNGVNSIGGQTRNYIARLDPATGLADSFDPNASGRVLTIAVQADGKILAGGNFVNIGGQPRNRIARLDPTTGLADSSDPNSSSDVYSIAVQADGKVLAGGNFTSIRGQTRNFIARLETDGRLDQTVPTAFAGGEGNIVASTAVQPDGKILLGGLFQSVFGVSRAYIARLNSDGTLDMGFNPIANGVVYAIAVQADGKILVGGSFNGSNGIGGQTRNGIARLDGTTGLADSFDPSANATVLTIAVQADGKILAGGDFTSIGGQARRRVARLDPATGLADSFDPNVSGRVFTISVQLDGKVLVGGEFYGPNSIGGQTRNRIARVDGTTGLADSFDPNANADVGTIAVQPDGKILVGGFFDEAQGIPTIGGQTRNRFARLDPATGLADSFNPDPNNNVESITPLADGKILAGGGFITIGGQKREGIARVDGTTGLPDSFNVTNLLGYVLVSTVQTDGKILMGGWLISPQTFTRLSNDTAALQNLSVTQTTITWTRGGSSPDLMRVTFEYSNDNLNYTLLGNGIPQGGSSNWILTGLSLSTGQNIYIRARGYYRSGRFNASESITESVRNSFITEPTATPPPTTPTPTPTPTLTPTPSPTPTATPSATPAAQAVNLSTRMRVQTGDNVGIGGFIITGSPSATGSGPSGAPKRVLLRAIGPSITGVSNVLADPVLELHGPGGFVTITNDNWRDDPLQAALILATGVAPTDYRESAIDANLSPGAYTAIVRGNNNATGVALIEVYDLSQAVSAKLANISTRAFVSTGDDIVIAGFILGSNSGNDRIVLRGIGPSLTAVGVPNVLANPMLELRDSNGALLMANNDWQENPAQAAELTAAGLAPTNPLESGIAATLPPGAYTALLAGLNNSTGNGVVEVYDRGAP